MECRPRDTMSSRANGADPWRSMRTTSGAQSICYVAWDASIDPLRSLSPPTLEGSLPNTEGSHGEMTISYDTSNDHSTELVCSRSSDNRAEHLGKLLNIYYGLCARFLNCAALEVGSINVP
jgi:hypothetical protein